MELTESLSQLFYEEASETLAQMEEMLLALEDGDQEQEVVHALFRGAHSLKGNSGTMGLTHISRFTHGMENALDVVRTRLASGAKPPYMTKAVANVLLQCVDILRDMIEGSKSDGDVARPECAEMVARLVELVRGEDAAAAAELKPAIEVTAPAVTPVDEPAGGASAQRRFCVRYRPAPELSAEHDPLRVLCEVTEYLTVLSCRFEEELPPPADMDPTLNYCNWEMEIETPYEPVMVRAVLELAAEGAEVDVEELAGEPTAVQAVAEAIAAPSADASPIATEEAPAPKAQPAAKRTTESQTIRVATEKVDALFNLTSEIVVAQSMLSAAAPRIVDANASATIAQMERHVRELHERVMAIRMVPVGYVFSRFPRLVRDLAASSGKEVHLEISGEETELDRTLLEALVDPLTHLLRNAMDHGLETPEERVAHGKPACGIVRLSAWQSEGRIHVEVSDDGRGIDIERVRAKAVRLGWIREDEQLAPETAYEFLFRPGFSTAEKVTDVSGRGVGMDVVKRNVATLGGVVGTVSEPLRGSRFTIKVPLTLAIMDGLTLRVGDESYIVPLTSVVEAFQPESVLLCSALGGNEMVNVRGTFMPLVKLGDMLQSATACRETNRGLLVILEQDEQRVAILADEIIGQQQIVMKSLETNYRRVRGFSGATILGDGRAAMIIDVAEIIRQSQNALAA